MKKNVVKILFKLYLLFVIIIIIEPSCQNLIVNRYKKSEIYQINENNLLTPKSLVTYIRAALPFTLFECIKKLTILRCLKIYLVQKMEKSSNLHRSGNLTKDFLEYISYSGTDDVGWFDKKYTKMSDNELTTKLITNFENFFKNRKIKLHLIPGVMVQVVPSTENKLKLTLKRRKKIKDIITASDESEMLGRKHKKKKYKDKSPGYHHMMLQVTVPVMLMPAILLGSFLPFILPTLKMATIMSTIMNNGALLAALMYAARTAAFNNDSEIVHYSYPGYH